MLNERRRRVLAALVEEYIASATPVGSKTLVARYELGCSPATVRNELSILEETGFVLQPHVSAGRLPTDSGYRSFVDDLIERGDPTLAHGDRDSQRFARTAEVDDLMRETSVALTQLTNCLAVVLAPSVSLSRVRRIDLLSLTPRRAVFVLITASGQVVNRTIELAADTPPERLAQIERAMNAALAGDGIVGVVIDEILDALDEADRDRFFHVGVPALLAQPEFHDADRARPLIEFLEDGIAVLEALSDALGTREITVRIGHENRRAELGNVSIVATNYGAGNADGIIGVIGPTRMNYERAMGAVRVVSDDLTDALS